MKQSYFKLYPYSFNLRRYQSSHKVVSSPASFVPNTFEDKYNKLWKEKGCFHSRESKNVFSMILPPPNVTGTLHLGHALTVTTQDVWARWRRMCGSEVVWVPGTDHAGIATQAVVEKFLEKEGSTRLSIGREKFIDEVWKWKNNKSSVIQEQLITLGSSLDWTREYFTMDDVQSKSVVEALLLLWNRGLIYRDEILVNWSPQLRSTISDIEVNKIDIDGPTLLSLPGYDKQIEFGKIVDFAYKVVGSEEEIIVSTTRIETMVGDVAVAVNPKDERYRHLWGSVLSHPFTGSEIPLILDYNVDPNFGTGAMKITPAHDKLDFTIGKSHSLPTVSIIDEQGYLINSGIFSGLKRYDARDAIMNTLGEKGLIRDIRPHQMSIPMCSRSGDVIELLIKPQWFLKCKSMADKAISAVKENKLVITPDRYVTTWLSWLENIEDWCISRQLWWGHQVPFYSCEGAGKQVWFPARSEAEAKEVARNAFQGSVTISRDTDVLDTWFSSAILPFSCFGWPRKSEALHRYYPLSKLITGNDILFFWVARMVMLGLELTDQLPFKEIFLHGIMCDSQGRKMSKSVGNIIDPDDIIHGKPLNELTERIDNSFLSKAEIKKAKADVAKIFPKGIPECGIDSLRFTLLSSNIKNQYINFDVKECEGVKRFCNKLWQVCKFANTWFKSLNINELPVSNDTMNPRCIMNKWILMKLISMVHNVNKSNQSGDFHLATASLRHFIHHDLCDIYVESIKPILRKGDQPDVGETVNTLKYVLESSLKCLSPFMPFLSEELYQSLPGTAGTVLMEQLYPSEDIKQIDDSVLDRVTMVLNIVNTIRRLKHNAGTSDHKVLIWLESRSNFSDVHEIIETLAHCRLQFGKIDVRATHCNFEPVNEEIVVALDLNEIQPKKEIDLVVLAKANDKIKRKLEQMHNMMSKEGYKQVLPQVQKSHQEKIYKLKMQVEKNELLLKKKSIQM